MTVTPRTPRAPWRTLRLKSASYRVDRRVPIAALIITLITLTILVFSISYGAYAITPLDVVQTLLGLNRDHPDYANFELVVFSFRLPRIVLAFLIGGALATSGAIMQGLTRNPLADPSLLGVNEGAALVAIGMIVVFKDIPLVWLPFGTFAGGLLTALVIYLLAWRGGSTSAIRLILVGIAVAALLTALVTLILVFGDIRDVQQAQLWLSGSVYGRGWEHVQAIAGWLLIFLPIAFLSARSLNALGLGEDIARGVGLKMELQRGLLLLTSVALAAIGVAVAGTIGFVGLVVPHAARRLIGPSHEGMLPISALLGGALLTLADLIGRAIIAPSELPVGIVTAMIGAPYFLYLLYRNRNH